jgi:hypothetical protein
MTNHLISMLDFPERYSRRNTKRQATPAHDFVDLFDESERDKAKLEEDERAVMMREALMCDIHTFMYHRSTMFYSKMPGIPPACYAATFHAESPFVPHMYHTLFMGFSMVKVAAVNQNHGSMCWKQAMNALVRDRSPRPPRYHPVGDPSKTTPPAVTGDWTPSLGRGGWLCICNMFDQTTGEMMSCVYVVAGLDNETYADMEEIMLWCYQQEKTVNETFEVLAWFRSIAIENRKRLLYLVVTHLEGLVATEATIETSLFHSNDDQQIVRGHDHRRNRWLRDHCNVQHVDGLPTNFQLPEGMIQFKEGEQEEQEDMDETILTGSEPQPKALSLDVDISLDDCVPYYHDTKHRLRLSHSCQMEGTMVRIDGPTKHVRLFKVLKDFDTSLWLHAFPAVAPFDPPNNEVTGTAAIREFVGTLDPAAIVNESDTPLPEMVRMYQVRGFDRPTFATEATEQSSHTLMPIFVRLSTESYFFPTSSQITTTTIGQDA